MYPYNHNYGKEILWVSTIQEQILTQLGILTIDDFYINPSWEFALEAFRSVTKCESEDAAREFLISKIPFTTSETFHAALEKQLKEEEKELKDVYKKYEKLTAHVAELKKLQKQHEGEWFAYYPQTDKLMTRSRNLDYQLKLLKPLGTAQPPTEEITALEQELASCRAELSESSTKSHHYYSLFSDKKKEIKAANAELKEINQVTVSGIQQKIYASKKELDRKASRDHAFFKKEEKALDFLFAVLLGVRRNTDDNKEEIPFIQLEHSEVVGLMGSLIKTKAALPKDWRQQLYHVCASPLRRFTGSLLEPEGERTVFFEMKSCKLSMVDLSAFLSLKMAALQNNHLLKADKTIMLALSGGFAALVRFREKGKVIAKHQTQKIETYINYLPANRRFVYHSLYENPDGTPAGVGTQTPSDYYIISEKYVIEISFVAAPMLLGFDTMAKSLPLLSTPVKPDMATVNAEESLWLGMDWEDLD